MSLWREDETVDGGGLVLSDHAREIAKLLALSEEQRSFLVAEIRNALVPDYVRAPTRGTERVLALMSAIANRV